MVYPVAYGLWMGSDPALYAELFSDPLYLTTVVNTLLFVAIGVNVKMFLAFLLSGFFMQRSWWIRRCWLSICCPGLCPALTAFLSIHYMLVTEWGFLDSLWRAVTGDGRAAVPGLALAGDGDATSCPTSGNGCRSGR